MQLKEQELKDLKGNLATARKALYDFRIAITGSKIKNVKEGRARRREIARILTEIRRREITAIS
ncbi:MAG: 50S ribosomal protein L29 [Minisyncoccota bacterium]